MSDRNTERLERELALLVSVRAYLRTVEGARFRIPTAADRVLDALSAQPGDQTS